MANSGYTYKEEDRLGEFTARGLLRYKDPDAYYCQPCGEIFNIECPRCKVKSRRSHATTSGYGVFDRIAAVFERYDGFVWTQIECRKCSYRFKVIVR